VQPVINQLHARGFSVKLSHVANETSWDDMTTHGYITILDAAGKKLAHREGFQHNRKLRSGGSWDGRAVEALAEEVATALAA
jgi:hypothetical protein